MVIFNSSGRRVVVADDDPSFTVLAESVLQGAGYNVVVAGDGAVAADILNNTPHDLVLVDLDMPRIDGLRLIGLLRAQPRLSKLGIIVVTGSRRAFDEREAEQVGADAFIRKPVNWKLLPELVRSVILRRIMNVDRDVSGGFAGLLTVQR